MFNRILHQLEDFFGISRKQARGTFLLIAFTMVIIWTPFLYRRLILPMIPPDTAVSDTRRLDSAVAALEKDPMVVETGSRVTDESEINSSIKPTLNLHVFDPNSAGTDELESLGIAPFLAKRIDKYRKNGGRFKKKDDLLRIYDFPGTLYQKLEPYISIAGVKADRKYPVPTPSEPVAAPESGKAFEKRTFTYKKPVPFDINTADTTALIRLKGIGSKLSQRILKFRDALGGFHNQDQFSEIYGLDSLALNQLQEYGQVMSPVRKLPINQISAQELATHPYFRNRKLADVIVNFREQHGPFHSIDDLKKIKIMDTATLEKITPYIAF